MFTIESRIITGSEIATREEAKVYFRTEDSGGVEDNLIQDVITVARETIEKLIDRSLIESNVTVYAKDWKGNLPFAPCTNVSVDGIASIIGNKYPYAVVNDATITYNTSCYGSMDIKYAVLDLALFWYERGTFGGGQIPEKIKKVIKAHTRLNFIA
jgi:hypothetical protein